MEYQQGVATDKATGIRKYFNAASVHAEDDMSLGAAGQLFGPVVVDLAFLMHGTFTQRIDAFTRVGQLPGRRALNRPTFNHRPLSYQAPAYTHSRDWGL